MTFNSYPQRTDKANLQLPQSASMQDAYSRLASEIQSGALGDPQTMADALQSYKEQPQETEAEKIQKQQEGITQIVDNTGMDIDSLKQQLISMRNNGQTATPQIIAQVYDVVSPMLKNKKQSAE